MDKRYVVVSTCGRVYYILSEESADGSEAAEEIFICSVCKDAEKVYRYSSPSLYEDVLLTIEAYVVNIVSVHSVPTLDDFLGCRMYVYQQKVIFLYHHNHHHLDYNLPLVHGHVSLLVLAFCLTLMAYGLRKHWQVTCKGYILSNSPCNVVC